MAEKKEQGGENGSDRVRMKKRRTKGGTNEKEKEAGGEKTAGEEGGSWDSWDTGEGCRPIKTVS